MIYFDIPSKNNLSYEYYDTQSLIDNKRIHSFLNNSCAFYSFQNKEKCKQERFEEYLNFLQQKSNIYNNNNKQIERNENDYNVIKNKIQYKKKENYNITTYSHFVPEENLQDKQKRPYTHNEYYMDHTYNKQHLNDKYHKHNIHDINNNHYIKHKDHLHDTHYIFNKHNNEKINIKKNIKAHVSQLHVSYKLIKIKNILYKINILKKNTSLHKHKTYSFFRFKFSALQEQYDKQKKKSKKIKKQQKKKNMYKNKIGSHTMEILNVLRNELPLSKGDFSNRYCQNNDYEYAIVTSNEETHFYYTNQENAKTTKQKNYQHMKVKIQIYSNMIQEKKNKGKHDQIYKPIINTFEQNINYLDKKKIKTKKNMAKEKYKKNEKIVE